MRLTSVAFGIALASVCSASLTDAQETKARAPASAHAKAIRQYGSVGEVLRELRQELRAESRMRLDTIADSLTAIALSTEPTVTIHTRNLAIITLTDAGGRSARGTAYAGAESRLLRIARESNSGAALYGLTLLANEASARAAMVDVATSGHPLAFGAVNFLANNFGPDGLATLRSLHDRQAVVNRDAKALLGQLADYYKWR